MAGHKCHGCRQRAVRHRNPRVRGRGDPGRYARNNLEWNRSVVHRLRFLAAAAEHEGITALEAHDTLSFARELHEQCVNLFLGGRVLRPAALANVVKLRPSSCPRARREQRRIGERVVHDGISGVDELFPSYRDETRITGASTDEEDLSFCHRYPVLVSAIRPTRFAQVSYSAGEISEGLISLRPPQNTFVYEAGMPASSRCLSIAALCFSTSCLSVPCATAMTLTFANSGPPSRQYACVRI